MIKNNKKEWDVIEVDNPLSFNASDLLPRLVADKSAAIKISNFYSKNETDEIVRNIKGQEIAWYPNFEYKQGRIGICATEYHSKTNGKSAYFLLEPEHSKKEISYLAIPWILYKES